MVHINLYLYNPHQASALYPFSSIDTSVNADVNTDADARCGQGLNIPYHECTWIISYIHQNSTEHLQVTEHFLSPSRAINCCGRLSTYDVI